MTMEYGFIDWWVVAFIALIDQGIRWVWYSPWLFGRQSPHLGLWSSQKGKISFCFALATSWVIAFFLAFFEGYLGITTVSDGMFVGFCLWLGFVVTTQLSLVIWGINPMFGCRVNKQPLPLFLIDAGYKLLSYLVMGGMIGA